VSFRKTLLQALIDVDNALSARSQLATAGMSLERSLEAAKTVERLMRYVTRRVRHPTNLLDAQESRRQAD